MTRFAAASAALLLVVLASAGSDLAAEQAAQAGPAEETGGVLPALRGRWGADCANPDIAFEGNTFIRYELQEPNRDFTVARTVRQGEKIELIYSSNSGAKTEMHELFALRDDALYFLGRTTPSLGMAMRRSDPPAWRKCR